MYSQTGWQQGTGLAGPEGEWVARAMSTTGLHWAIRNKAIDYWYLGSRQTGRPAGRPGCGGSVTCTGTILLQDEVVAAHCIE
jgi:hypothetical protein